MRCRPVNTTAGRRCIYGPKESFTTINEWLRGVGGGVADSAAMRASVLPLANAEQFADFAAELGVETQNESRYNDIRPHECHIDHTGGRRGLKTH